MFFFNNFLNNYRIQKIKTVLRSGKCFLTHRNVKNKLSSKSKLDIFNDMQIYANELAIFFKIFFSKVGFCSQPQKCLRFVNPCSGSKVMASKGREPGFRWKALRFRKKYICTASDRTKLNLRSNRQKYLSAPEVTNNRERWIEKEYAYMTVTFCLSDVKLVTSGTFHWFIQGLISMIDF